VLSTAAEFGEFLTDNKLYFFEEYTDHGSKHIESILNSTANLITEKTFNDILSGKDIGCFILSTILHDIAMQITLDGFNQLLSGEFDDVRVRELDKLTWAELWNDYLNEAKKFSGKQLVAIFGEQDTIIRKPPLTNKGEVNGNDKKLIGEFIRRHHPRLAHEIALKGFPGKDKPLEFARGLDTAHKTLIGLIARSHGLDLRVCVDYIESAYGVKTRTYINEIHAAFLMILLRLADYLQIDRTRTSTTLLKVKSFSSPFSEFEHKAHLAIDHIDSKYQNDPERIFVHASPQDSKMYLKIRNLIQDIQHEFDISWAVLGELYGSIEHKPAIRYRRITSNLHEETFRNKQTYVADKLYFKSNDDIAKLLIAPLYGNQSKYGVRELLQNSVDACREREIIEKAGGNSYKGTIDINISEDADGHKYLEIKDNGIGMSIEIVKDYFLTAGASYRKSFDWQKTFTDPKGNSSVTRSGRFGVGVLAAFLIGKSVCVQTKHIKNNTGYKFSADLNESQINILKDETLQTGTLIKIKIDDDKISSFAPMKSTGSGTGQQYDWTLWYALSDPTVNYYYHGNKITPPIKLGPDPNDPPAEWRALDTNGYNKIFWTYDKSYVNRNFICNGIVIPNSDYRAENYLHVQPFSRPKISVVDNNGLLPLTLNRDQLSDHVSFQKDLMEELCKDFLAYVLLFNPQCYTKNSQVILGSQNFGYPGLGPNESLLNGFYMTKDGFVLKTNQILKKSGVSKRIELVGKNLHTKYPGIDLDLQDTLFTYRMKREFRIYDYINEFKNVKRGWQRQENIDNRVFLRKEKYEFLFDDEKKRAPLWLKREIQIESEIHNVTCINLGTSDKRLITDRFLELYNEDIIIIKESKIPKADTTTGIMDEILGEYLGENVIIPYSLEDRKALYPRAFEELEYYMLKHRVRRSNL